MLINNARQCHNSYIKYYDTLNTYLLEIYIIHIGIFKKKSDKKSENTTFSI